MIVYMMLSNVFSQDNLSHDPQEYASPYSLPQDDQPMVFFFQEMMQTFFRIVKYVIGSNVLSHDSYLHEPHEYALPYLLPQDEQVMVFFFQNIVLTIF